MTRAEIHQYAQKVCEENALLIVDQLMAQGVTADQIRQHVVPRLEPVIRKIYAIARREFEVRVLIDDGDPDLAQVN
jgi:hypothetical protein